MRRYVWAMAGLVVVVALIFFTTSHADTVASIENVKDEQYIATIDKTLADTNSNFKAVNLDVNNIQYVGSSTAVVKVRLQNESTFMTFLFEIHANTLYLTNYSPRAFTAADFSADSKLAEFIVRAANSQ